jgi:hypothetical protein
LQGRFAFDACLVADFECRDVPESTDKMDKLLQRKEGGA